MCKVTSSAARNGFTLIELVTVLLIVGVLAYFAMPKLTRSTFDQKALGDKVINDIEYARKYGVAARRYVCIRTTTTAITFTYVVPQPEASGGTLCGGTTATEQPITLPAPDSNCGGNTNQVCAPSGYSLSSGAATLIFDDTGSTTSATAGNSIQFTATTGSTTLTLATVEGITGYVH